jgi:N-acetylmuramoyl-L-alanine amidase
MILLSAGHSNADPGAVANGVKESDIAVEARNIVRRKLETAGYPAVSDGTGSDNKPLAQAVKLIAGKTLAVEFHCNAAASSLAGGVECISLPSLREESQAISAAIAGVMGIKLRGDKGWIDQTKSARGRLAFVAAGGIIVELFFLSNPAELKTWQEKKWLVCQAIANAIEDIVK